MCLFISTENSMLSELRMKYNTKYNKTFKLNNRIVV